MRTDESTQPRDLIKDAMGGSILERPLDPLYEEYLIIPTWFADDLADIKEEYDARDRLKKEHLKNANRLLFTGPPGTGKTVMARHLATQLKMEFFQVRSDRMVHSLYGYEERVMGKLWDELQGLTPDDEKQIEAHKDEMKQIKSQWHSTPNCKACNEAPAKCCCSVGERLNALKTMIRALESKNDPKVVLMDEIEMFALHRGKGDTFKDKALTILLERLEQFRGDSIFVGATNMGDALDPAIWRRFDKVVEFKLPNADQRRAAIDARFAGKKLSDDEKQTAVDLSHNLSFSELRMAMDKALKRAIVKEEKKQLGMLLRVCVETEAQAMKVRGKGHLHQPPPSGFRKSFDVQASI